MKWFGLKEFRCKCCTDLPVDAWMYVEHLVNNVLDPVREKYGKPIRVTSGFRCEKHNAKVGGAKHSQHLFGQAADIVSGDSGQLTVERLKEENRKIAQLIVKNGKFDQLILENVGEHDLLPQWVHVSYNPRLNRGMVLKKVVGKARYPVVTTEEICRLLGGNFRGK